MINLKIKYSKLIYLCISLHSINAFSEQSELINIIEENWNSSQTISGRFHQEFNDDDIIS